MSQRKKRKQNRSLVRQSAAPVSTKPQITEITRQQVQFSVSAQFSGPLPPPAMLHQYEEMLPGTANRIITMAENQSKHRLELENSVVAGEITRSQQGMWCGAIVAVLALGGGILLAALDKPIAGGICAGVPLLGIVGTFVYGTDQKRRERVEKTKILAGMSESMQAPALAARNPSPN